MFKKIAIGVAGVLAALLVLLAVTFFWFKAQMTKVESTDNFAEDYFSYSAVLPEFASRDRAPCTDHNVQKNAYFGELHVHTAVSHDSVAFGNLATPEDAYNFAQGESITLRLSDDSSRSEKELASLTIPTFSLQRPLDFAAVTDHAENFGESHLCLTPGNEAYETSVCRFYRGELKLPVEEVMQPLMRMLALVIFGNRRSEQVCGADGRLCIETAINVWEQEQRAAERAYDRSENCSFTSFVAYEYSLAEEQANLHRNIIFANAIVPPVPMSSKDETNPVHLWEWLRESCIDSGSGCDVISIPHNSNWSSGRMFYPFSLMDLSDGQKREYSLLRQQLEPLVEIMQVKGDSECRNGFKGVIGAADEHCDFEKLREPELPFEDCGEAFGKGGMSLGGCLSKFSYVRYALTQGLKEQQSVGVNPFSMGIIAATDNHTGASGAVAEDQFRGSTGIDRNAQRRLGGPKVVPGVAKGDTTRYNPGGLAGVWAEENTRESLFVSMKRKETFGTSGPRIQPRMFAGWDFDVSLCNNDNGVAQAYAGGVAMGGTLTTQNTLATNPLRFFVSANKDGLAHSANLQKIQIVKGWVDDQGQLNQRVYDVVGDTDVQGALNTHSCEPMTTGHQRLCAVWQDEEFDANRPAVYYTRVIENPSCRWSTYDCLSIPESQRPTACENQTLPKSIQERAWTSPIWYQPS